MKRDNKEGESGTEWEELGELSYYFDHYSYYYEMMTWALWEPPPRTRDRTCLQGPLV